MKKLSFGLLPVLVFLSYSVKCDKSFVDDEIRSFIKRGNERSHRIQSVQKHRNKRGILHFIDVIPRVQDSSA